MARIMVNLLVLIIIQNWDVVHNMLTRPEATKVLRDVGRSDEETNKTTYMFFKVRTSKVC